MTAIITRVPASFRFQSTLLEELKSKAKASNRSLNNYVESLLISILHPSASVDNLISPELQAKIDKVVEEHNNGNFVRCSNSQELQTFLDSI